MQYVYQEFEKAFLLLDKELQRLNSHRYNLVICGGSALNAANLIIRTTKDVDILALCDDNLHMRDPEPLPSELINASKTVADNLGLPADWLNNGPSHGDGGLFRMGLPPGLEKRLASFVIGEKLTIHVIGRIDQIFLKLYASVDQFGGYHAADLEALNPTDEELVAAARWSMTHDVSEGYRLSVKTFLNEFGYEDVSAKI